MAILDFILAGLTGLLARDAARRKPVSDPHPVPPAQMDIAALYASLIGARGLDGPEAVPFELYTTRKATAADMQRLFAPAIPPPGVVPKGVRPMAMDDINNPMVQGGSYGGVYGGYGFTEGMFWLGFPYLSELAQRTEYRRISETIAKDMTRRWFRLQATGDDDKSDKITAMHESIEYHKLKEKLTLVALLDGFFGRSHLYIDTGDTDDRDLLKLPLPVDPRMIKVGGLKGIRVVEPMWAYPNAYNAADPLKQDFYLPMTWWVTGKEIHRTRLLPFIGREMPDMLKPAYSFGGLSLSQMAKPYVDNWLRTRQSVSDIIHSFSTPVMMTNMGSILNQGAAAQLRMRSDLFNFFRDNNNLMVLDKTTEDFKNVSAPLGGLDHLQAQAQEHMSSAVGIPLVVLLGISPSGLNATSEGELQVWAQFIKAAQASFFDAHLKTILHIIQLDLFGEIDPSISHAWEPLREQTEEEEAAAEKQQTDIDTAYINAGVLSPDEIRQRLSGEADSPYQGLDLTTPAPPPPQQEQDPLHGAPGGGGPPGSSGPPGAGGPPGGPQGPAGNSQPAGGVATAIPGGAVHSGAAGGSAAAPSPKAGSRDAANENADQPISGVNTGHTKIATEDPNATIHVHLGKHDRAHVKLGADSFGVAFGTDYEPNQPRNHGEFAETGGGGAAPAAHHESGDIDLGETSGVLNPSRNDLAKMLEGSEDKELRGLFEGSRFVVWPAASALHQSVQQSLGMSDSVHRYTVTARQASADESFPYQVGRYAAQVYRDGEVVSPRNMPKPLRAAFGVRGDMGEDAFEELKVHRGQPENKGEFASGGGGGQGAAKPARHSPYGGQKAGHSTIHFHADPGEKPTPTLAGGIASFVKGQGKEDFEALEKTLWSNSPEARKSMAGRVVQAAKAVGVGIWKEETGNIVHAAGGLKSIVTLHNPTPEQWEGLRRVAFRAAMLAGLGAMGGAITEIAHAESVGEVAGIAGKELLTHILAEHALKFAVGAGMAALASRGHGGVESEPKPPAHDALAPTSMSPQDTALVQKFLLGIADGIQNLTPEAAKQLLANPVMPPDPTAGQPAQPAQGQAHDKAPFDPGKHPRGQPDNPGQFGPGGGASSPEAAATAAAAAGHAGAAAAHAAMAVGVAARKVARTATMFSPMGTPLFGKKAEAQEKTYEAGEETFRHKLEASDKPVIHLFHGTASEAKASILKDGILPHGSAGSDEWMKKDRGASFNPSMFNIRDRAHSVFVAASKHDAMQFARYASIMHPGSKPIICVVDVPKDEAVSHLKPDEFSDEMRFDGVIKPEWIKDVIDPSDMQSPPKPVTGDADPDAPADGSHRIYVVVLADGQSKFDDWDETGQAQDAEWVESEHTRGQPENAGEFGPGGGGAKHINWKLPPAPGTAPIPEGHVRLYHQTSEENLGAIKHQGLQLSKAQGVEGPRAIYADTKGFYGKPGERPTVEFHVPKEQWDPPFVKAQSVDPANIIAVHRPWHDHARYVEGNPDTIKDIVAGERDDLLGDPTYGKVVRFIKHKYGQGAPAQDAEWIESEHPRGQPKNRGEFASSPGGGGTEAPEAKAAPAAAPPLHAVSTPTPGVLETPFAKRPSPHASAATPAGHHSVAFVSPSVAAHLDLSQAIGGLTSKRQKLLATASVEIDNALHLHSTLHPAVGAWSDGAENSIMTEMEGGSWDQVRTAVAMKASLANQKAALIFQEQPGGAAHLFSFQAHGSVEDIHKALLADGVQFHTIVPTSDGATVYAVDMGGGGHETADAVMKAATRYGAKPTAQPGRAEFVGADSSGTDAEQRHKSQLAYGRVIDGSGVHGAAAVWKSIRPTYGEAFAVSEFPDTETTIPLPGSAEGEHPALISTRRPTSVSAVEGDEYRRADMAGMKLDDEGYKSNMGLLKNKQAYPMLRPDQTKRKTSAQIERAAIDMAKANLRFLYENAPADVRDNGRKWYEGAHDFAAAKAKQYKIPLAAAVGTYAALSPQNQWEINVRQGDAVLDIYFNHQHTPWSPEMTKTAARIYGKPQYAKSLARIQGKTLADLQLPLEKAMWIRTYDEAHNSQGFNRLTPDGRVIGPYYNLSGTQARGGWKTNVAILNAVNALESGGNRERLSLAMGDRNKVRSFYNNILEPDSKNEDVTMDTHAVGAVLLTPDTGESTSVAQSLGTTPPTGKRDPGWEGASSSKTTGSNGTYGLWADAYRELAHELHIQPRVLQSVTWVAKRKLFDGSLTAEARANVYKAWQDYHAGKGTLLDTQRDVLRIAGGMDKPEAGLPAPPKPERATRAKAAKAPKA